MQGKAMDSSRRKSSVPQLRRFSIFTSDEQRRESLGIDNRGFSADGETSNKFRYGGTKDVLTDMSLGLDTTYSRRYTIALKTLKPFRPRSKDGKIPIQKAGLFSYLFISWISSLVWKLFRKRKEQLTEDDIWECSEAEMSKPNTERMKRLWDEELAKRGPKKASVLRIWFMFTRTRIFVTFSKTDHKKKQSKYMSTYRKQPGRTLYRDRNVVGYLLELIVTYLESTENDLVYGLGLVAAMLAGDVLRATSFSFIILFGIQTGVRFRAGYLGLAYHKLLKLRNLKGKTLAEMITLYGSDGFRVFLVCAIFVYILAFPVYLIIGTVYTYYLIGPWCFIAVGVFLICYQLQACLTRIVAKIRKKVLVYTDKRVRKMTEVLNSMKLIKMYAWESSFKESVEADVGGNIVPIVVPFRIYGNVTIGSSLDDTVFKD
ncbi:hypothetical protein KUTeg_024630 [Tegillarca granosa]|uniref:ABC transmembrane type-1 domain-containing protein n=1 Tax=Tegillarca granosa TaxID=220873 RepID=A0ABQ9DXU0_TEGGR|nr:hypothetical protein KUTeg_024630 [Tegillarca granosa]